MMKPSIFLIVFTFAIMALAILSGCGARKKIAGGDPYFRGDPGAGIQQIEVHNFDIEKDLDQWEFWRPNDGRIAPDSGSSFTLVENPFEPAGAPAGSLIRLTTYFDPAAVGRPFGGYGIRAPINPALALNDETYLQFDLYYPKSAADTYMRFEIWSTSSGGTGAGSPGSDKTQVYIRTADLDDIGSLNPQWSGYYNDETWFKKSITAATPVTEGNWEYVNIDLPTSEYRGIRDSGKPGEYKMHGHVLAWYNQSPSWMRRIVPENVESMQWNPEGLFYAYGNNAAGPFRKVNKNTARRVYFDHILYEMRHFMTTDARYDSSEERGIIPFHSFDVLNEEIHESRHSVLVRDNEDVWKTALKHLSWLMAMTDDDIGDIGQHYIYLLFKYAHIAVPNARMAAQYKAGYNDPAIVPEYMKLDNHDHNGSIDAYITKKPPILVYNDYDIAVYSRARVAYNMIKELNTAWKSDPLYDGRNLIECMGIQGHDTVNPTLASRNQNSVRMYATLIDNGLLDWICYSELDLKMPGSAPGGAAFAPDVLNQKQADVIGYQYALLFKVFDNHKKYIDHVIIWGQEGSGFQKSYVPFDQAGMASQAYYGLMNPDKFIKGHSYLDSYFAGEYAAVNAPASVRKKGSAIFSP